MWYLLFLLIFVGPPKFRIRDPEASLSGALDLPLLIQVFVYLLAGAFLAYQSWRTRSRLNFGASEKLAVAVLMSLAVSAFMSDYVGLSFFKTYQLWIMFWFGKLFVSKHGFEKTLRTMLVGHLILFASIILGILLVPEFTVYESETGFPRIRGTAVAETGLVGPLLLALALSLNMRSKWLLTAGATALTFFSLSRAAWIIAALLFIYVWLRKPHVWSRRLAATACVAGLFVIPLINWDAQLRRFRDPSEVTDLSERPEIWAYVVAAILDEAPWMGMGFGVGSRLLTGEIDPALGSAHSIFLDVLLAGGVVALALFIGLILAMGWQSWQIARLSKHPFATAVVLSFLVIAPVGLVGGEIDAPAFGPTLWLLASLIPSIHRAAVRSLTASPKVAE